MPEPINDLHERAWTRALRARNLSPRTIVNYLDATRALRVWSTLDDTAPEIDLAAITSTELQQFFGEQTTTRSATTAAIRFRALQQFFKWALEEEVRDDNPIARLAKPLVPEAPVTVLTVPQIKALLDACGGRGFDDRRDHAMIRLFMEPGGARLAELTNLQVGDVDMAADMVKVMGKGRKERSYPFGPKTGLSLERYLRERARHPRASSGALWLGKKGPMTASGVQQMLRRRAAQVGIDHLYPHMFRHTAAHEWLANGGNETDAQRLFGWSSPAMLQKYGRSVASQRAQDAARRLNLGERY